MDGMPSAGGRTVFRAALGIADLYSRSTGLHP